MDRNRKFKGYIENIEDFEVVESMHQFIEDEHSIKKRKENKRKEVLRQAEAEDSDEDSPVKQKRKNKMSAFKGSVKSIFGLSKKEENDRKIISSNTKKLPKNFAN
jgi:hypothetical protein